jgi:hypothetical protein
MNGRRKLLTYMSFAVGIALVAGIIFLKAKRVSWDMESEKTFIGALHNSLWYLDLAKLEWAEANNKSEQHIPTLKDLQPYLGTNTGRIERFMALGITYKLTPNQDENRQSDVAMLTRDLRFRSGICRFYPAGMQYSLRHKWVSPQRKQEPVN